jgi:hypothetical protein
MTIPSRVQLEAVMVRRMKNELKVLWDGSRRFAERRVEHLEVPYAEEEKEGHRALQEYTTLRAKNATTADERFASEFVLKPLKKRLFSSPAAFELTLAKHVASLGAKKTATVWQREVADYGDDYADDDQYESETSEVVSSASQALSPLSQEERNLLKKLSDFAAKSSRRPDSKTQKLNFPAAQRGQHHRGYRLMNLRHIAIADA